MNSDALLIVIKKIYKTKQIPRLNTPVLNTVLLQQFKASMSKERWQKQIIKAVIYVNRIKLLILYI